MEKRYLDMGSVGMHPKGAYDKSVTYSKLQLVTYRNNTYLSKQDGNIGHEPVGEDDWWSLIVDAQTAYDGATSATAAAKRANDAADNAERINAEVQAAEDQRIASEQERTTAETARDNAEQARKGDENLRKTAEVNRVSAETDRSDAEQRRTANENSRETAEQMRKSDEADRIRDEKEREDAETSRKAAENLRDTAENDRNDAEQERRQHEDARADAEGKRDTAETLRKQAETGRDNAEQERTTAEQTRKDSEASRVAAEQERTASEQTRQENETARVTAETERKSAEQERTTAETERTTSEQARQENETTRVSAETERVVAELSRQRAEAKREQAAKENKEVNDAAVAAALAAADTADTATGKANTAAINADTATANANAAADAASKVNVVLGDDNVLKVTDRTGAEKSLELVAQAAATEMAKKVEQNAADIAELSSKISEERTRVDGELEKKFAKADIVQEPGNSEKLVMSQKAVSDKLNGLSTEIIYDVSAHNDGAVFESLQALLSSSNLSTLIPTSVRHGGMSIRFVQSSDNKYVQYRLIANTFSTTVTDWQGVDDEPTTGSNNLVKSGGVADSINKLKNAGYLYAGIATPTTNPGTPDGNVFYIANGKGTYTNFGGIDVTEDEVVILYYDTVWHKNATGIASNDKLTELEEKVSEVGKESIDTEEESIVIKDNDDNVLAEITPEGSAFRNLKNNGKDVLTEHQDISGLATKDEIKKKQDRIDGLDSTQEETDEEEIVFGESDADRTMTVRKDKVIVHKSLVDGEDNPIKSVEVGRKRNVYTLDSSSLSGLVWGGDKVYRGSDTANSYVIALDDAPLILSFVGSNPFSMVMFDTMPEIGSVGREVDFTRCVQPSEGKYVMLYGKVSEFPSEIVIKKFGVGLTGLENLHDSLAGKTITVFGDSVMEGVAASDGVSCPEYLSMYTNAKVINCAIGGTRIVPRNTTSEVLDNTNTCYNRLDIYNLISAKINGDLTEQINAAEWVGRNAGHLRAKVQVDKLNNLDLSSVDVFIIEGGCNDFMSTEKSKDEICQGLQRVIQIIMTNFPNARIYYVCPTVEWYIDRDESHYSDVYDFGNGFTLKDLVEGLNKTAHDMCIPYYDAYHRLGWNRFNFNHYFRTNTTHPETGYEYMAQKIGAFLVNDMFN